MESSDPRDPAARGGSSEAHPAGGIDPPRRRGISVTTRRKLIEVALPREAIAKASAREKSIRHGQPNTLHLWWARRPLAAAGSGSRAAGDHHHMASKPRQSARVSPC
ncbi:MAG: DUF1156 domain-containing protein [Planctomycetota bacterium]